MLGRSNFMEKDLKMAKTELKVVGNDTHFENILAFYLNDRISEKARLKKLSDKERELKTRWESAFMFMLEWGSMEDTVKRIMRVFKVSKVTAYRDIQKAEMLFGSFKKFDRQAWRYIQLERKQKLYQLAMKQGNLELAQKIDSSIDKLLGLDKDDNPIDLDKLMAQNYDIVLSKKQSKLVQQIFKNGGAVNMNVPDAVEIDFEEVRSEGD